MTAPDGKLEQGAVLDREEGPRASLQGSSLKELGGWPMLLCKAALGIVVLLIWQGASGRLVDNFFIPNPIDAALRLFGWPFDVSIFRPVGATVYATAMGFFIGAIAGAILGVWLGV